MTGHAAAHPVPKPDWTICYKLYDEVTIPGSRSGSPTLLAMPSPADVINNVKISWRTEPQWNPRYPKVTPTACSTLNGNDICDVCNRERKDHLYTREENIQWLEYNNYKLLGGDKQASIYTLLQDVQKKQEDIDTKNEKEQEQEKIYSMLKDVFLYIVIIIISIITVFADGSGKINDYWFAVLASGVTAVTILLERI